MLSRQGRSCKVPCEQKNSRNAEAFVWHQHCEVFSTRSTDRLWEFLVPNIFRLPPHFHCSSYLPSGGLGFEFSVPLTQVLASFCHEILSPFHRTKGKYVLMDVLLSNLGHLHNPLTFIILKHKHTHTHRCPPGLYCYQCSINKPCGGTFPGSWSQSKTVTTARLRKLDSIGHYWFVWSPFVFWLHVLCSTSRKMNISTQEPPPRPTPQPHLKWPLTCRSAPTQPPHSPVLKCRSLLINCSAFYLQFALFSSILKSFIAACFIVCFSHFISGIFFLISNCFCTFLYTRVSWKASS